MAHRQHISFGQVFDVARVSVRTEEQFGTYGNRIGMLSAPIFTNEPDPALRLQKTHEALRSAKERHKALPAQLLQDMNPLRDGRMGVEGGREHPFAAYLRAQRHAGDQDRGPGLRIGPPSRGSLGNHARRVAQATPLDLRGFARPTRSVLSERHACTHSTADRGDRALA